MLSYLHLFIFKNDHPNFECQRKRVRRSSVRCLCTFFGGTGRCPPPEGQHVNDEDGDDDDDDDDGDDDDGHHVDDHDEVDCDDLTSSLSNSCKGASRIRLLGSSTPFTLFLMIYNKSS